MNPIFSGIRKEDKKLRGKYYINWQYLIVQRLVCHIMYYLGITIFPHLFLREQKHQEALNMVDQRKIDDSSDKEAQELAMPDHGQ